MVKFGSSAYFISASSYIKVSKATEHGGFFHGGPAATLRIFVLAKNII